MGGFALWAAIAVIGGAVLAFDIGGIASRNWEKNTDSTRWARKRKEQGMPPLPNVTRLVVAIQPE